MSTEPEYNNEYSAGTPRWVALAVVALAAVSVLGVGIGWNANAHAHNTEQTLQAQTQQNKTLQQGINTINDRLAQTEDTNTQLQGELKLVTDHLKMTQGELANARQQARQIRTEYSSKLDSVQTEMAQKANASDVTMWSGYRLTAQTRDSDTPVLPPVYSTTAPFAARRPSASADSIIASAMRSFILPVGFSLSTFTRIRAPFFGTMWRRANIAVLPMHCRMSRGSRFIG